MRSIRRSLIGYFLILTLVALTAMGIFIDQYTLAVLDGRRSEETKRVHDQFEKRRQEELEKLDQSLLDQAYALAAVTQFNTFVRQYNQAQRDFSKLEIAFGLAGPFQAATIPALVQSTPVPGFTTPRNPIEFKVRQDYYANRIANRTVDSSFFHTVGDQEHFQDLYQIQQSPTQTWHSASLGSMKLPEYGRSDFQNAPFLPSHDEISLPNGTVVRRVVLVFPGFGRIPPGFGTGGGRGWGGGGGGRPQPNPQPPPPEGGSDGIPRLFVQVARPIETLLPKLVEHEQERQERLSHIDSTADREQNRLRVKLIAIVSAAVGALLVGSLVLTRRGLKPLARLTDAVSRVSEKDFLLPVRPDELSTELAPVHARITGTLDALRRAFDREKQAVADISHELRTPIAALGVTLDVALKKTRTADQYKQTLAECRDINAQLGKLVERIMTLAMLDSGTGRTALIEVDAADLATSCATIIKPLAEAHGMAFTAAIARPLPVTTDADKLREVLMNLLHNAVEYNRPGGVIELTATRDGQNGIAFGVRDSGIGMTSDVREKIFERFYRADPSRTATGIHAGLGLAIVKEYVARLGGAIDVESSPNVGSTFRVTIPGGPNGTA